MPPFKPLRLFLFLTIFAVSALAQNLTETALKIRASIENKDYQTAVGALETLEKSDKKIFEANNYDYLLARASEKNGDFAAAMAAYQAVVNRNSILSEYALSHLAQIARASGNLMLERLYLNELLALAAPDSLLIDAADARMTRSYFESKNFDAVIQFAERGAQSAELKLEENSKSQTPNAENKNEKIISRAPQSGEAREDSSLLGQAYLRVGKPSEARAIFTRLIDGLPDAGQPDDYALTAAKSLDEIDGGRENSGKSAPEIPEVEHLKRARVYQFNRNFPLARLHYQAIVERYPQSEAVADALFQIGRGFAQERNFNESVNWFERVSAEFPDAPVAKDALAQAASAYARAGKPKVAIARYQTFIEKYPNAENLDRAYLNIVDVLRDQQGEDANALKWAAKTQEVFKGKLPEAVALFTQARIHIALSDWQKALADLNALQNFSDLGGARVPGGTNKAETTFLRALVLENVNSFGEAIDVYLSIPDGRNEYYGWRASERLRALANDEKTSSIVRQKFDGLNEITKQNISVANAENVRQSAQSAVRLLSDDENRGEISAAANQTKKEILLGRLRQAYALLPAYQKVPGGKLLEFGRREITKEARADKNQNSHRNLADELFFLGLYDEAAPELEANAQAAKKLMFREQIAVGKEQKAKNENLKSSDFDYTLAVFYKRGERANRAVAYSEPLWRNVPADYQIELIPREQIELLYPAPYREALLKYAPERNVDARLLLSIMRQESRFRADVKSVAAARGLMQFISTTGETLAGELGRKNFKQDELYNPPTAILFGAQYLSDLFKQFPNQPQAVAAGYNGGEDNVLRWLKRANTTNADRYVPEIVYTQSKDYVYKVMANYRVYQMFYDEKLK